MGDVRNKVMSVDKRNSKKAEQVTSQLPSIIKNKQIVLPQEERLAVRVANTMMATAQEYTLAIEEVLKSRFGFTEKMLTELEYDLKNMLSMQADVKRSGFKVMNQQDMHKVGELAKMNLEDERVREAKEGLIGGGSVPMIGKK